MYKKYILVMTYGHYGKMAGVSMEVFENELMFSLRDFLLMGVIHNPNFTGGYGGDIYERDSEISEKEYREMMEFFRQGETREGFGRKSSFLDKTRLMLTKLAGHKTLKEEMEFFKEELSLPHSLLFYHRIGDANEYGEEFKQYLEENNIPLPSCLRDIVEGRKEKSIPLIFIGILPERESSVKGYGQRLVD